jgi:hypothetical protein
VSKKGVFEDITLSWLGTEYLVPANKVMGAIKVIENHITLAELYRGVSEQGGVKMVALSEAYAALLKYAGARFITSEEVYGNIFSSGNQQIATRDAIMGLLSMMIPPDQLRKMNEVREAEEAPEGEAQPGQSTTVDAAK